MDTQEPRNTDAHGERRGSDSRNGGLATLHGIIGCFGYGVDRDPMPFSDDGGNPPVVI